MKKQFKAKKGYFVYPHVNVKGEKEVLKICPGDEVIVNGKKVKATAEYVNQLYSIVHREALDDETYEENKDALFESRKVKYSRSSDEYDIDPIEDLPDTRLYAAHGVNGRSGIYFEKGEETHRMEQALEMLEEIKNELTPAQVDLIFDLYGRNMRQTELAEEKGTSRQVICNQDARLKNSVKRLFAKRGIDESFFDEK